jgi:hypothetical protein
MKRQLEVMMREVDQVASNFSGLDLEFADKPREVRDRDVENARMAQDLDDNRKLEKRMEEMESKHSLMQQKLDRQAAQLQRTERMIKELEQSMERIRLAIHRDLERCATIEEVKRMLEAKDHEMREFLGHVVKKVPRPHRITVKKKYLGAKKVVKLTFKCPRTDEELVVKSRSFGLWLKFAFILLQTGKSALEMDIEGAAGNGMAALQAAYAVYNEAAEDRASFDTLMRAPLLLSKEQDELVGGLRKEGFFEKFFYNAQTGEWEIGAQRSGGD